jgi:hypothetical protein
MHQDAVANYFAVCEAFLLNTHPQWLMREANQSNPCSHYSINARFRDNRDVRIVEK